MSSKNPLPLPGQVAWYATGQFYVNSNGNAFDVGYFPFIAGLDVPFFSDSDYPSPAKAHFTFSAIEDPFSGQKFANGGVNLTTYPPGSWKMYLNRNPGADFQWPETFSNDEAEHIATFRRETSTSAAAIGTLGQSVLTFSLIWSKTVSFGKKEVDIKALFPNGVTQLGFADGTPLPPVPEYPSVSAFFGSALKV